MTDASMEINVSYTNWRGVTSVRRVLLGDVRFGTTEWHEEPTWLIKAFDLDHPAQIWKDFDLLKCDFNREELGKNNRIGELEASLEWYAAHVADCRKIGRDGDVARGKLDRDGGSKARAALKVNEVKK
jgi:hypothetical protein